MAGETLFIDQGCDYITDLLVLNDDQTPANISGYSFSGFVRQNPYSNLTVANLVITIQDGANGYASLSVPGSNTANIEIGTYFYSVLANTGNVNVLLAKGDFIIGPNAGNNQPPLPNVTPQILNDTFYALAGQNSFYLSYTPANTSNVFIVYNGTPIGNSTNTYTVTGKVLIFANSATQGDVIVAYENDTAPGNSSNTVIDPRTFAYYDAQ